MEVTARSIDEAMQVIDGTSKATVLKLEDQFLSLPDVNRLAAALRQNSNLRALYLRRDCIEHQQVEQIADAVEQNSTLIALHLGGNNIAEQGAKSIACALRGNSTLSDLRLRYNGMKEQGAKDIADALKENTSLTVLDLEGNQIGDDGAAYIAAALKSNSTLTSIDLRNNRIGDSGAEELLAAFEHNEIITTLKLCDNTISPAWRRQIEAALERNRPTQVLMVDLADLDSLDQQTLNGKGSKAEQSDLKISCTSIGGKLVATFCDVDNLADLLKRLGEQLNICEGRLRLVLQDGTMLHELPSTTRLRDLTKAVLPFAHSFDMACGCQSQKLGSALTALPQQVAF